MYVQKIIILYFNPPISPEENSIFFKQVKYHIFKCSTLLWHALLHFAILPKLLKTAQRYFAYFDGFFASFVLIKLDCVINSGSNVMLNILSYHKLPSMDDLNSATYILCMLCTRNKYKFVGYISQQNNLIEVCMYIYIYIYIL